MTQHFNTDMEMELDKAQATSIDLNDCIENEHENQMNAAVTRAVTASRHHPRASSSDGSEYEVLIDVVPSDSDTGSVVGIITGDQASHPSKRRKVETRSTRRHDTDSDEDEDPKHDSDDASYSPATAYAASVRSGRKREARLAAATDATVSGHQEAQEKELVDAITDLLSPDLRKELDAFHAARKATVPGESTVARLA